MARKILIAAPRGWCAGVERAVEIVERTLTRYGPPVYVRKQIVHNLHVVRGLEEKGAVFVESEDEVPEGAVCVLSAHGVYQWYRARAAGETLTLLGSGGEPAARFTFPRQPDGERLCLADYVRDDADDYVALFAVTCGGGVRERAAAWKERGEYLRSHALQALAIETAEAFAEWLHARLRTLWGFPDPPELSIADKLKARYRGLRVSFGYPACPELADQATLWRLLRPEEVGIALTEGYMMDPEASVSALVFHHPAAKYFKATAD